MILTRMSVIYVFLLGLIAFPGVLTSQSLTLSSSKSTITVSGTSSMHDWTSNVESMTGSTVLDVKKGDVSDISDLKITIPVESIKSGKNGMDKKTYEALKQKEHANIIYMLTSFKSKSEGTIATTGDLTVAGKTNTVNMDVHYMVGDNGRTFSGNIVVKMTDFGIKPVKALMGTIKTGDEVTIAFNVLFSAN